MYKYDQTNWTVAEAKKVSLRVTAYLLLFLTAHWLLLLSASDGTAQILLEPGRWRIGFLASRSPLPAKPQIKAVRLTVLQPIGNRPTARPSLCLTNALAGNKLLCTVDVLRST